MNDKLANLFVFSTMFLLSFQTGNASWIEVTRLTFAYLKVHQLTIVTI